MHYDYSLIHMTNTLESLDTMYSIICLKATRLSLLLNGTKCYLDGKYMLCLSQDDTLSVGGGQYEALNLHFQPYFYNVNLNHNVIGLSMYEEMRSRYGYPDFHLFRQRDDSFTGILSLSEEEYEMARRQFLLAAQHIDNHPTDKMWSCNARSNMISILRIAEGAYQGDAVHNGNDIFRYIREHVGEEITLAALCQHFHTNRTSLTRLIKEQTGMSPMQYVLEERLNQSRPDLLFTLVPIQDLAEKYGFSDVNYYIRAFRKRFGQTPLQYRIEGRAERIRNEAIYHRKEKDMMKVSDFKYYIESGLGRGLTLLRKEPDKTPYRQTVMDYYTKNIRYSRMITAYDAELIRCFPDADALSAEIAVVLFDELKKGIKFHMIPMLVELGYKDTVSAIVEMLYSKAYAELLEFTQRGDSEEKYPACAGSYIAAVASLGYLQVSRERMKRAMLDTADLYLFSKNPVVPTYQSPWFLVQNGYGRVKTDELVEEVAREHPHGQRMFEEYMQGRVSHEPRYAVTAQQIFDAYRKPFDPDMHIAFAHATEDVIRAVAEEILREEDVERRLYLMSFFDGFIAFQPMFPLDPTPLIDFAKALRPVSPENRQEYGIVSAYYSFLGKVRHPEVRALGQKILADKSADSYPRELAAKMVFGANFEKEDAPAFIEYLKTSGSSGISAVPIRALDMGYDLPVEVIECAFVFAESNRYSLVQKLLEKGKLPDPLREECRLDSSMHIRKLVTEQEN